jgi:hypothetical protein
LKLAGNLTSLPFLLIVRPGRVASSRSGGVPPDKVQAYLEFARSELGEQVAIYLRPERWLSADLGSW